MEERMIAERYARALCDTIEKERWDEAVDELRALQTAIMQHESAMHYLSAMVPLPFKQDLLSKILVECKFLPAVASFFGVLLQRQRFILLPYIIDGVQAIILEERNMAVVRVRCSFNMTDKDKHAMLEKLTTITGKRLTAESTHDPSLIGGFVLQVGHVIYDYSVKNKLKKLEAALSEKK